MEAEALLYKLIEREISVEEADEILKQRGDEILSKVKTKRGKRLGWYECFFCGSKAWGLRRVVFCRNCGVSPSSYLKMYLEGYGVNIDDVREELMLHRVQLTELAIRVDNMFTAKVVAYHYFKDRDYRKARIIISDMNSLSRRKLYSAVKTVFGKSVCLNDCMINLFIEKAEEHDFDADSIHEGVQMLKEIGEKTLLRKSVVAAVFWMLSGKKQKEVAKIFGVSDVAIRSSARWLRDSFATVHPLQR